MGTAFGWKDRRPKTLRICRRKGSSLVVTASLAEAHQVPVFLAEKGDGLGFMLVIGAMCSRFVCNFGV